MTILIVFSLYINFLVLYHYLKLMRRMHKKSYAVLDIIYRCVTSQQ